MVMNMTGMGETLKERLEALSIISIERAKKEFPTEDWKVREAEITIPISTDGSDDEFLRELDQLLKKYGKFDEASLKCTPEFYNEDEEEWWTIGELKDFIADLKMMEAEMYEEMHREMCMP